MLNQENLIALGVATAKANKNAPVAYSYDGKDYSYEQVQTTLRNELNELAGSHSLFRENKNKIFSLIEEVVSEVLPNKVAALYEGMAEVKTFGQGDKPIFRRRVNARTRAKQFVTRVGLEGVYEVFKLGGSESFEVPTSAVGGAAQIGLEEFLDGRVDFAELLQIVMDGIEETIQLEVGQALIAGINQLPAANKVEWAGFDETEFDRLLTIVDSYGTGKATIYCDFMFAAKIMPAEAKMTEAMKNTLWEKGYFMNYKGHTVVVLPNGVADETNSSLVNDPSYCWMIPAGSAGEAPVRIAFEGETLVDERKNADWSRDVQVYKKAGVAALLTSDVCVYHDTSISKDLIPGVQG